VPLYLGVGLFVFWTSHGGLRKEILSLFGSDASSSDLRDQVGHVSDLLYYYAIIATALTIIISLLKVLPGRLFTKLHEILPNVNDVVQMMLDLIHYLIIFSGVYVYLIHKQGSNCCVIKVDLKIISLCYSPFGFW
jgi:hypothetical protein